MFRVKRTYAVAPTHEADPPRVRKVEFAKLPRVVQDHFIASTSVRFPPWPILRACPWARAPWGWAAAGALAVIVVVGLLWYGFGDPSSALVVHPAPAVGVFATLLAFVVFACLRAISAHRAHDLPFRAGVYLFPSEVVDARGPALTVHPVAELTSIELNDRHVRVRFLDHCAFTFPVADAAAGELAVAQVARARDALEEVHYAPSLLGLVDPLYEPWEEIETGAPAIAVRTRKPFRLNGTIAAALAIGAALGPTLSFTRDAASDRVAYGRATARGDPTSLRAYAAHGRRGVAHVTGVLLPLAELRSLDGLAAIDAWTLAHPAAATTEPAVHARKQALVRHIGALATVREVRAFGAAHPNDSIDEAIAAAIARMHASAVPENDGGVIARLLALPGSCGSSIAIEIRRGRVVLAEADRAVMSSRKFAGTPSYPSRYFGSGESAERAAQAAIAKRIETRFPEGCLIVSPSGSSSARLTVTWTPRFNGTLVSTATPPAVFAEIGFVIEARLVDANGKEVAYTKRTVAGAVDTVRLASFASIVTRVHGDDTIERRTYHDLVQRALLTAATEVSGWMLGPAPASVATL